MDDWMTWLSLITSTIGIAYVGWAFYRSAFKALLRRTSNMDTLIAMGASVIALRIITLAVRAVHAQRGHEHERLREQRLHQEHQALGACALSHFLRRRIPSDRAMSQSTCSGRRRLHRHCLRGHLSTARAFSLFSHTRGPAHRPQSLSRLSPCSFSSH